MLVADQLSQAMGKRVVLHYKEFRYLPTTCFGETTYFVDRVEVKTTSRTLRPAPLPTHQRAQRASKPAERIHAGKLWRCPQLAPGERSLLQPAFVPEQHQHDESHHHHATNTIG